MKKTILLSFIFVFSFLLINTSKAEAATLYFNAGANNDWGTRIGNWWNDASFSSQASSLPTTGDDVIISGNVTSNSGATPSINTMTVNGTSSVEIPVTVANGATFNDTSTNTNGSNAFVGLGQTSRIWYSMAAAPNGNVYAAVANGSIYMQTNGTGNFVSLSQTNRVWDAMAAAPNGNVYAAASGGDIYICKQMVRETSLP